MLEELFQRDAERRFAEQERLEDWMRRFTAPEIEPPMGTVMGKHASSTLHLNGEISTLRPVGWLHAYRFYRPTVSSLNRWLRLKK